MIKGLVAMMLATTLASTPIPHKKVDNWKSIGEYRITTYDIYCNEPQGRQSSSGKVLEYGDVAMNGVPIGTKISIEGEIFTVVDRCGIDNTVDIFIENDSGYCQCNTLDYKEVKVKR